MEDDLYLPDPEELIESHESPDDVLKTLEENAPDLPERFEDHSYQELLDIPASKASDEEAEQLARYILYQREMGKRYEIAKEEME